MKIKELLTPLPDQWASIAGKNPASYHNTEELAGAATEEILRVLNTPDLPCSIKRLACYRLKMPEIHVRIDPSDKDSNLQLGKEILAVLGKFASKVSVTMRGVPTAVKTNAKTQRARPPTPKGSGASVEWGNGK